MKRKDRLEHRVEKRCSVGQSSCLKFEAGQQIIYSGRGSGVPGDGKNRSDVLKDATRTQIIQKQNEAG